MSYRSLDPEQILSTLDRLHQRITERFPDAALTAVSRELVSLARFCVTESREIGRPNWPVRWIAGVLILAVIVATLAVFFGPWIEGTPAFSSVGDYLQGLEAFVNNMVFLAIAIWFLGSLEGRLKRRRALKAIHQLRSLAHVVDMHQLTKDPAQILAPVATTSSPSRTMSRVQLGRYLDYCSEMLALISKVAALFVQESNDPMVLAAVDEVSGLTLGLAQKIWQKLAIVGTG